MPRQFLNSVIWHFLQSKVNYCSYYFLQTSKLTISLSICLSLLVQPYFTNLCCNLALLSTQAKYFILLIFLYFLLLIINYTKVLLILSSFSEYNKTNHLFVLKLIFVLIGLWSLSINLFSSLNQAKQYLNHIFKKFSIPIGIFQ